MNSVRFEDPYDHINPTNNIKYDTHHIDTHVEHNRENSEQEEPFEEANEKTITEEEL